MRVVDDLRWWRIGGHLYIGNQASGLGPHLIFSENGLVFRFQNGTISSIPEGDLIPDTLRALSPAISQNYLFESMAGGGWRMIPVPPPAPVITSFTSDLSTVVSGNCTTLRWTFEDINNVGNISLSDSNGNVTELPAGTLSAPEACPLATTDYALNVTGPGGSGTASLTVTALPRPTITNFDASPSMITAGESSTLSWSIADAEGLSIDNGIGAVTGDSKTVSPASTTTYHLTATGNGVSATREVIVTVVQPPVINSFSATPNPFDAGGCFDLNWATTNAITASLSNGLGTVAPSGGPFHVCGWQSSATITLTARNAAGRETSSSIFVALANRAPVLGAIGNKTINEGSLLTFTVSATDPDGNALTYSASGLPSGATFTPSSRTFSWTPTYSQSGTYSATFTASDSSLTDTETITITVSNVPAPTISSFSANPTTINRGSSSVLSWSVTGATSLSISGVGGVTGSTQSVSPTVTTTYTLTATNAAGSTISSPVTITVNQPPAITSFVANDYSISVSTPITFTWQTSGATNVYFNGTAVALSGTKTVTVSATTIFTLKAVNAAGVVQQSLTVELTTITPPPPPRPCFINCP